MVKSDPQHKIHTCITHCTYTAFIIVNTSVIGVIEIIEAIRYYVMSSLILSRMLLSRGGKWSSTLGLSQSRQFPSRVSNWCWSIPRRAWLDPFAHNSQFVRNYFPQLNISKPNGKTKNIDSFLFFLFRRKEHQKVVLEKLCGYGTAHMICTGAQLQTGDE